MAPCPRRAARVSPARGVAAATAARGRAPAQKKDLVCGGAGSGSGDGACAQRGRYSWSCTLNAWTWSLHARRRIAAATIGVHAPAVDSKRLVPCQRVRRSKTSKGASAKGFLLADATRKPRSAARSSTCAVSSAVQSATIVTPLCCSSPGGGSASTSSETRPPPHDAKVPPDSFTAIASRICPEERASRPLARIEPAKAVLFSLGSTRGHKQRLKKFH